LNSRYYNPEWGRFINADAVLTSNLFAYCNNNPVSLVDPTGFRPAEGATYAEGDPDSYNVERAGCN
jgi:uncharacterized protein RhaS with RHS repeats